MNATHNHSQQDQPHLNVPCRKVEVEGFTYLVPRGIARNTRNKAWQVKVARAGEIILSGNYADDSFEGTAGSLKAAVDLLLESHVNRDSAGVIRLTDRVSLSWAELGKGVIGARAIVYDPSTRKGQTIYLVSQKKMLAGKTEGLAEKIVKALELSWKQENQRQSIPMNELLRMRNEVSVLMESERFKRFSAYVPA